MNSATNTIHCVNFYTKSRIEFYKRYSVFLSYFWQASLTKFKSLKLRVRKGYRAFWVFLSFCQRPPLRGGETPKILEGRGGVLDTMTKTYMFTIYNIECLFNACLKVFIFVKNGFDKK